MLHLNTVTATFDWPVRFQDFVAVFGVSPTKSCRPFASSITLNQLSNGRLYDNGL
jgi:hypothetical protein